MPILRDMGTTVNIASRNGIRPEMLTGEQICVQQMLDKKPICLPLAEVELKGKFGQLKTKAAVVYSETDKGKYLLGNHTSALLRNDRESFLFPKIYALQNRTQKRVAEQEKKTGQLRNAFSKGIKTKEVGKFRNFKVLASYVSTSRNSGVTAKTNETVNQLKTINEKKRLQLSEFSEVQSPATSTCKSINDTKIKSVMKISRRPNNNINIGEISVGKLSLHSNEMIKSNTRRYNDKPFVESMMKISKAKRLVRPNKNNVSVNAIEESHFLQPEVISEVGDEILDTISQVNCQELECKDFSIKSESDINKEFLEDADFGFEPEQENHTAESLATENILRKIDENDFRQVKTLDKSDPLNVEDDFSQSCCCEYKSCDSSTVRNHIFTVEMRIKKDSEDKNAESNESKCVAMDTSETLIIENGVTNDKPDVAVDNFSLSDELHGPQSLLNYG
ncbi:hypothetical protein AVEN_9379-1 [Araneus ventricosus]|uniref:Uncharacterized protein n=1 Tax=Araneus ventricosus TaxID=182803 RepID=A0A4Y2DJ18_ARAVE|nr:hypothetical protein AVEN_9379-1 [Araneus ventricosus]